MTARKHPPLLRHSELTGRIYVITRYTRRDGLIVASEKWDVTEDFSALIETLQMVDPPEVER